MKKQIALTSAAAIAFSMLGFVGCTNYSYDHAEKYTAGGATLTQPITALDIDWVSGDLEISYGEADGVSFFETSSKDLSAKESLHYWLDGTVLRIRYAQSRRGFTFKEPEKSLKVVLPADWALQKLEIESVSADIHLVDVHANYVELESVSGEIGGVLDGTTQELSIESVSGDVDLYAGQVKHLSVDSVSGDIDLEFFQTPDFAEMETTSGDITLRFEGEADFSLEFETVSGKFVSEYATTQNGDTYVCGSGANSYEVETVSGDLHIDRLD